MFIIHFLSCYFETVCTIVIDVAEDLCSVVSTSTVISSTLFSYVFGWFVGQWLVHREPQFDVDAFICLAHYVCASVSAVFCVSGRKL